jgi:hypothetical protein
MGEYGTQMPDPSLGMFRVFDTPAPVQFAPYCPVPVSAIFCGLAPPLSVSVRVPIKLAAAFGVNLTPTWQLRPAPRLDVQPLLLRAKPVPFTAMELKVKVWGGKVPPLRFLMVIKIVLLLGRTTVPKATGLGGLTLTSVPVPLSDTLWRPPTAASVKLRAPARELMFFGEKSTDTTQLVPEMRVTPLQVFVFAV